MTDGLDAKDCPNCGGRGGPTWKGEFVYWDCECGLSSVGCQSMGEAVEAFNRGDTLKNLPNDRAK